MISHLWEASTHYLNDQRDLSLKMSQSEKDEVLNVLNVDKRCRFSMLTWQCYQENKIFVRHHDFSLKSCRWVFFWRRRESQDKRCEKFDFKVWCFKMCSEGKRRQVRKFDWKLKKGLSKGKNQFGLFGWAYVWGMWKH